MSIGGVMFGVLIVVGVFVATYPLAELFVPQSEIDKVEAVGRWAKKELERREKGGKNED